MSTVTSLHNLPSSLPDGAPDWARVLHADLLETRSAVVDIQATIAALATAYDEVSDEIGPVLNRLTNSPLMRMITGGK